VAVGAVVGTIKVAIVVALVVEHRNLVALAQQQLVKETMVVRVLVVLLLMLLAVAAVALVQ
jgi:hypothetical protein